jgi:AraC-like DNA-binding protein
MRRMQKSRTRLVHHDSPEMQFELAFSAPHPSLRPYVREYVGGFERASTPVCRRELPSGDVPLIINFDGIVRERTPHVAAHSTEHRTFTAGLHDAFTIVESCGPSHGIQVTFTALGARLFYDRPLVVFTNRTIELEDVFGRSADTLVSRLYDATTWDARFDMLDDEIRSRIAGAELPAAAMTWAWQKLVATGGCARIADIRHSIGWSERHFAVQFRHQFGLAPKAFARVLRFRRAARALDRAESTLAGVALACGYYDQAHFTRDFRAFAGIAPRALLESRLPQGAGFRAEQGK